MKHNPSRPNDDDARANAARRQLHTVYTLSPKPNLKPRRGKVSIPPGLAPSGATRARRGTLSVVQLSFWTAFSSLNPPLLHYSKNRWANKFLGLGDGRVNEINVERKYVSIHHTQVPSFETFQKKQEETKRKRTYLKTQHFLPIFIYRANAVLLPSTAVLWVLFLFPILAEPALRAGRPFISSLDATSKDARKSASRS